MSEGIKRMLAEREALATRQRAVNAEAAGKLAREDVKTDAVTTRVMALIDKAAKYLDATWTWTDEATWRPSSRLTILYCMVVEAAANRLTIERRLQRAEALVNRVLNQARRRYMQGLDPNPWAPVPEIGG